MEGSNEGFGTTTRAARRRRSNSLSSNHCKTSSHTAASDGSAKKPPAGKGLYASAAGTPEPSVRSNASRPPPVVGCGLAEEATAFAEAEDEGEAEGSPLKRAKLLPPAPPTADVGRSSPPAAAAMLSRTCRRSLSSFARARSRSWARAMGCPPVTSVGAITYHIEERGRLGVAEENEAGAGVAGDDDEGPAAAEAGRVFITASVNS